MLKIVSFIKANCANWKEKLMMPPYSLKIKRKGELVMFNYTQGVSEPSEIVNEARGLILKVSDTVEVIRYGFYRFYNYGETGAALLNLNERLYATEKIDGTLVMFYYYNGWHMSTRNTFDAQDATIGESGVTFDNLISLAMAAQNISYSQFAKGNTYVFELVSPLSQIIIPYKETKLYFLMARNNTTLEEFESNQWLKPQTLEVSSFEQIANYVSAKDGKEFEGVVIKDRANNRVKVKNLNWLKLHKLYNNGRLTPEIIFNIIDNGEQEEYLSYFPEARSKFEEVLLWKENFENYTILLDLTDYAVKYPDKKEFALRVNSSNYSSYNKKLFFAAYDRKAAKLFNSLSNKKLGQLFLLCPKYLIFE